jgi:hypothetical protein
VVSNRPSTDVDWTPYRVTGAVLGAALLLNLWTGNGLWFWYSTVGAGLFFFIVGLTRQGRLHLPRRSAWMLGIAGGLHYVGGSLSGLHSIGGPNGLYYVFPWWDNVVHALGAGALAVAVGTLMAGRLVGPRWLFVLVVASVASLFGILVELYEFAQFLLLGTIDQGFYTNTVLDLYYNLLGAVVGAVLRSGQETRSLRSNQRTAPARKPTDKNRHTPQYRGERLPVSACESWK